MNLVLRPAATRGFNPKILVSKVRLQEAPRLQRYETKRVVLNLIERKLAEWVVRGSYARLIDPPQIENGWKHLGTFKSFKDLSAISKESESNHPLPASELPGIKFVMRNRFKNQALNHCALQF